VLRLVLFIFIRSLLEPLIGLGKGERQGIRNLEFVGKFADREGANLMSKVVLYNQSP